MKRVGIYYDNVSSGRNDGAPLYAWHVLNTKRDDVEVTHLIPKGDISDFGRFDWHLWVDWGEDALAEMGVLPYEVWPELPNPCAYWASDTHLGYDYRLYRAKQAARVFCMQKRAVEEFAREGVSAEWLPHAVEPEAYPAFELPGKKYDLCFVGHVNSENRIEALDRMFREFPNFWFGQRLFEDAARKFAESKIVFNVSIKDDVNMRVFETLATRSFLLTNALPTLGELFEDGKHLVTYSDLDDAVEKARWYLAHDEERERIARAGYEEVIAKHTYAHRLARIVEVMGQ
jgi:O-antigen biosynthesis protein